MKRFHVNIALFIPICMANIYCLFQAKQLCQILRAANYSWNYFGNYGNNYDDNEMFLISFSCSDQRTKCISPSN